MTNNTQSLISNPNKQRDKSAGFGDWTDEASIASRQNREKQNSKQNKVKQIPEAKDPRLASFEIASFQLPDYPDEKIVYVKFLDDNDPRLLFLVTYNSPLSTTYMKVIKIEK